MADEIALAAEEVLRALKLWKLPVDPFAIIREEKILLAPGAYDEGFGARIEYFPPHKQFGIFYRQSGRTSGRIRFSLSHELGHFYLPEHLDRPRGWPNPYSLELITPKPMPPSDNSKPPC